MNESPTSSVPFAPLVRRESLDPVAVRGWVTPHLVTVSIDSDRTRVALDTGDECCICDLRLGTRRLLQTWAPGAQVDQGHIDAMTAWAQTLIRPLVEPLRRSRPLDVTFTGEPPRRAALMLGEPIVASVGRYRIDSQSLSDWQARFDVSRPHTEATRDLLATVVVMRAVLDAAQTAAAVVVGNALS
jgi:hypothetical protein